MNLFPAHEGLTPTRYVYEQVDEPWNTLICTLTGARKALRACHSKAMPLGYYRLEDTDQRTVLFGKIIDRTDLSRTWLAACVAADARSAGMATLGVAAPPIMLDEKYCLIMHEWLDGQYFQQTPQEVSLLGNELARLHAYLRCSADQEIAVRQRNYWNSSWRRLEELLHHEVLPPSLKRDLQVLVTQKERIQPLLTEDPQPLHNDLHPGNVLFNEHGKILAFLDFEETITSVGSVWLDVAWVLERFCMPYTCTTKAEDLAQNFVRSYASASGRALPHADVFHAALRWKNFHALGLLHEATLKGLPLSTREWEKFTGLLYSAKRHNDFLKNLFDTRFSPIP